MINCSDLQTLAQESFYVIDAPGINGMGSDSLGRLKKHIENGGRLIHKVRTADDGSLHICEPQGMWPNIFRNKR
tara:strand:- start:42 stop:263 length:222 start_codon:yes stop_codon:yes gene_type:complete